MRRPIISLVFISALTFLLGLGRQAITDSDEGFYAEASREMVESGDWLTPRFNYENRWEKPALYYWLSAAAYVVTGPTELSARLWSALSGVGLVLLTWAIARSVGGGADNWLAGAMVATSFGYFAMARAALPDLPLAFCITLGIFAAVRAVDAERERAGPPAAPSAPLLWWGTAGLAAGLGFLVKGPVALVVPGVVLLPIWWRERRTARISLRGVVVALGVFIIVGVPWYVLMALEHGRAYLDSFFLGDNLQRFATDRFQRDPRQPWFYIPIVVGGLMPWSAYLCALLGTDAVQALRRRWHPSTDEWRLVIWAVTPVIFYTLSIGKQPRYILPVLPPLAILLARAMRGRIGRAAAREGGEGPAFRVAAWISAVLFALLAVLLLRLRPIIMTAPAWATWAGVVALLASSLTLAWITATRQWRRIPIAMTVSAAAFLLTVAFGVLSGIRPEPVEEMADLVREHRRGNEQVGEYQAFVRNLVFYLRFRVTPLYSDENAVDFMRAPARMLLVVSREDLARIEALVGSPLVHLGRVSYLNTANLRLGTLLFPDRTREWEEVYLVANR